MPQPLFKNVLISVSDKTGLLECVEHLSKCGAHIVSTGGTARLISSKGISVLQVHQQTGFPEVMDGRVKTLHPHIFIPLLARKGHLQDESELSSRGLKHFDLVICNLYPFEKTFKEDEKQQMEWVDIGGVSLLRASAKNFEKITVICDPKDYKLLKTPLSLDERRKLAVKVFSHLSSYDRAVARYLSAQDSDKPSPLGGFSGDENPFLLEGHFFKKLRYGENPQQKSSWYHQPSRQGLHTAKCLQGKPLSFNNVLDIQSAVQMLREFKTSACFIGVKHNNPCGSALADSLDQAVQKGVSADPVSLFGGIVAVNKEMDLKSAQLLSSIFLECIIAPSYSRPSLELLSKKKNLRLVQWDQLVEFQDKNPHIFRVDGGFLIQDQDHCNRSWGDYKIYGESPSNEVKKDMEMAWKICKWTKSNAICLVHKQQTVGIGMGQVDRITAVELAFLRMEKNHKKIQTKEVVMASDGFFPFSDSVEKAAGRGVRWIIQPGGSVRDNEVIKTAKKLNVNMVLTGTRHFKH